VKAIMLWPKLVLPQWAVVWLAQVAIYNKDGE
jgi:hypothetical protein